MWGSRLGIRKFSMNLSSSTAKRARETRLQWISITLGNPTKTVKILIVDDDEGVTQTFARMLRLEGYQVNTAVSAETGLEAADVSQPDAIILDLRMPLVDGLGFLRR